MKKTVRLITIAIIATLMVALASVATFAATTTKSGAAPVVKNTSAAYTKLNTIRKNSGVGKTAYNKAVKKAKKIKNKSKRAKALKKANTVYANTYNLKRDAKLEQIALQRAKEIAETGKFSHTRPNGKSGLTLIPGNVAKGENIAMGQITCEEVSQDWYNSASHRQNMLRSNFNKVGIAGYTYKGVTYWAQVFSS